MRYALFTVVLLTSLYSCGDRTAKAADPHAPPHPETLNVLSALCEQGSSMIPGMIARATERLQEVDERVSQREVAETLRASMRRAVNQYDCEAQLDSIVEMGIVGR